MKEHVQKVYSLITLHRMTTSVRVLVVLTDGPNCIPEVVRNMMLLLLLLVEPLVGKEECTLHRLQGCLESLQSVAQGNDLALAATKEELMTVCATMKSSVFCVDKHIRNCFTSTQIKVFNQVVSGARKFLKELCISGSTQDVYLKHSPCYRNLSLSEERCAQEYRLLIDLAGRVNNRSDVDEGLKQSCCAFSAFIQCKHNHARKDCGQEASNFLQQHLDRISNPLIHEHCEHYTHAQNACVSSGSAYARIYQFLLITYPVVNLYCMFLCVYSSQIKKFQRENMN